MKYFIVKKNSEYVIFRVKDDDVDDFRQKYAALIVVEANNLMQLLLSFERDVLFSLDYLNVDETMKKGDERKRSGQSF